MKKILDYQMDNPFEYENGFYITSHPSRMGKLLAHYELYKLITHLPGHIFEFGVHKGCSLIRFATFRELLESPYSRKIYGFDTFTSFPKTDSDLDNGFIDMFAEVAGQPISKAQLMACLDSKKLLNIELIEGNILQSLPEFIAARPETKAALIHIDVDVYQPSKVILEEMVKRMVPGGIIVLDDYGTVEGETRAVDEFFNHHAKVEKLPISHIPCFIRI
ncbi:TylF/MycF/NovP-related O-methyltransferase [Paraglaciecola hydrolytica]|uniref:dTDP-6-deoxy-L-hexose 3-O-methyltransferase n=1 Tax=Paraglaciecola hydrolytica TaxID=1799789 RepID=A0A148KNQ4_9ALTE|nr:TylF/MycF/NovP-related O-methyltransferase [Paraglaciecola hydrolytica]KXI27920.1 dTDP-6-deoxy-L-hexose 3-O-methyltransferase [Paraglaciecola hydrolytica]